MVGKMPNATWLEGSYVESIKGWQSGWFYITEPRDTNWVAAPRISIRNPHAAHFLEREGPVVGRFGGADRTPILSPYPGEQEAQACQRGPGHALPPDSPVSTTGIQFVGVRPGLAPYVARALRHDAQGVRTPTRCHIDLAGNTSYHFAASRTVFPRVSPYLCPGPFAPFGSRI